mgnify:FL=1|tara:strand:+ start:23824 stop:24645 length:822 start_codon:yes stop_codon:yes gene_type:complete
MSKCTSYDKITFKNGILDSIVDAVYVILLKGSKRTEKVYKQINEFKLSKNNFIQINENFKDCHIEDLCSQTTYHHIAYNTINVLKHANENNFKNILVFEDDFILDEEIKDEHVIHSIDNFISNNDFNLYFIGCIPYVIWPSLSTEHVKVILGGTNHSVIYSKEARDKIINIFDEDKCYSSLFGFYHIDMIYHTILRNNYMYYKPLCYQPLIMTENRKDWTLPIIDYIIELYELDKDPKKGFNNVYKTAYILYVSLLMVIISVTCIIIYKNKKK